MTAPKQGKKLSVKNAKNVRIRELNAKLENKVDNIMSDTKIEWTDKTWNPITGCSKISPGCARCYAERMAKRLAGRYGYDKDEPFRVTFHHARLVEPLTWKKPSKIFVCSMGDLFHDDVPFEWQYKIFNMIEDCHQHIFIILTKRPLRMEMFYKLWTRHRGRSWPLPNVWLGVTCENQEQADKRIPILLQIPAAVRFVSVEPCLSSIDLIPYLKSGLESWTEGDTNSPCPNYPGGYSQKLKGIDWVICGAETGPGKRPMKLQWAIDLHEQCEQAGVPYFFKKDSSGNHHPLLPREYPK